MSLPTDDFDRTLRGDRQEQILVDISVRVTQVNGEVVFFPLNS
jgi:hypothetical protein